MIIERATGSEAQTHELASRLGRLLAGGDVIGLSGELGAGKTCFVRGLAAGLGIDERQVSSPTFTIAQEYERSDGLALAHLDAYRLSGPEELESIGFAELLEREDTILAIEWAERIADALPPWRTIRVRLDHAGVSARRIRIEIPASKADRFSPLSALQHRCLTCGRPIAPDAADFPFCAERCRMADLHGWFSEKYRISRALTQDDEPEV